jgi:phenylacetic acid degradation operon negative regulatory protein
MVAAGELEPGGDGAYGLTARLAGRQVRQEEGWHPLLHEWDGTWRMAVVVAAGRSASARAELRAAATELRLVELREGIWLRPDNLDPERLPSARRVLDAQCRWFAARPGFDGKEDRRLAVELWDLTGWAEDAIELRREMGRLVGRLEEGDDAVLARSGLVSAAVLRHFVHDPLLPPDLLPARWPGETLRREYDRFERALRRLLRDWEKRHRRDERSASRFRAAGAERPP